MALNVRQQFKRRRNHLGTLRRQVFMTAQVPAAGCPNCSFYFFITPSRKRRKSYYAERLMQRNYQLDAMDVLQWTAAAPLIGNDGILACAFDWADQGGSLFQPTRPSATHRKEPRRRFFFCNSLG